MQKLINEEKVRNKLITLSKVDILIVLKECEYRVKELRDHYKIYLYVKTSLDEKRIPIARLIIPKTLLIDIKKW